MATINNDWATEYGIAPTAKAAIGFCRSLSKLARRFWTEKGFVRSCRAIMRREKEINGCDLSHVDGRLIAACYLLKSSKPLEPIYQWVRDFERFIDFWNVAVQRPGVVGSCHNQEPHIVYRLWRLGYPAWMVKCASNVLWDSARDRLRPISWKDAVCIARACRRFNEHHDLDDGRYSTKLLVALGKLCPELQMVALSTLPQMAPSSKHPDSRGYRKFRVADVDWEKVGAAQKQLQLGGPRCRVAIIVSLTDYDTTWGRLGRRVFSIHDPRGGNDLYINGIAKWLCPEYVLPPDMAAKIRLGVTPVQLSGNELSRQEAHDWLTNYANHHKCISVLEYLQRRYLPQYGFAGIRSVRIIRWLIAVKQRGGWEQLTKQRVAYGPAGQKLYFTFLSKIDEVQDVDLISGEKTSVRDAFDHVALRMKEKVVRNSRPLCSAPAWKIAHKSMRWLTTTNDLMQEGDDLAHCVGSYASAVEQGQCYILSVNVLGHRSTVEVLPDGRISQHYGFNNARPHELNRRLVSKFVEWNQLRQI